MQKLFMLISMLFVLVSCGERKDMIQKLQSLYDQLVGPGQVQVESVKKRSEQKGYFVVKLTYGSQVSWVALNYGDWDKDTVMTVALVNQMEANGDAVLVTPNGNGTYTGTDGKLYETTTMSSKDLEKTAGIAESVKVGQLASKFASEFGLSEERSLQIAKTYTAFKKVSTTRSLTEADANHFTNEVLGVSMNELYEATTNAQDLNSLIEKAAEKNAISPEHMNEIVNMIVNQ